MRLIPVLALFTATVGLGLFLGYQYLRRIPSRPTMIGIHLLLGAGGMELVAMLLAGTPDGEAALTGRLAHVAAALLLLALFTGLLAPMIGRRSRPTMNAALATHACAAGAGFVLLLAWFVLGS
jgi:hypothetical protein